MKSKKKIKDISEMLNARQYEAIVQARSGIFLQLIQVCLECHKAEQKALSTIEMGVPEWGTKTAAHYQRLRNYLEMFFNDDASWKLYQSVLTSRE